MENTIASAKGFIDKIDETADESWRTSYDSLAQALVSYASACSAPSSIVEDDYNKLTVIAAWFLNEDEGDFERPAAEYLLGLRSRLSERKIVLPKMEIPKEYLDFDGSIGLPVSFGGYEKGWNAYDQSIKRLNGIN